MYLAEQVKLACLQKGLLKPCSFFYIPSLLSMTLKNIYTNKKTTTTTANVLSWPKGHLYNLNGTLFDELFIQVFFLFYYGVNLCLVHLSAANVLQNNLLDSEELQLYFLLIL
jgi:hypothetical protein